ncbi:MAG: PepSY domain-containing protein [Firmicutes bacterium]|nr:PepSY domain-containing protein [Bacillota bacterium]
MSKRYLAIGVMVSALILILGGQAIAAPPGKGEIVLNDTYVGHHSVVLKLVDKEEAIEIARKLVTQRRAEVESAQLVLFRSQVAWEVLIKEKVSSRITTHEVMVDLFSGRVLQHEINKTSLPEGKQVDRDRAIAIAKNEVARPVEVKATAHMQNSRLWTINLAPRDADPAERIYLTIREDDGRVIERGRITAAGRLQVASIGPEEAVAMAQNRVKSRTSVVRTGLALERNTLVWEVHLRETRMPTTYRFLIDAITGRVLN